MADNLEDEWWETGNRAQNDDSEEKSSDEEEKNAVEDHRKRPLEHDGVDQGAGTKKKQKRKRKKITTELKEKGKSSRAKPADVIDLLSKHFEGKLSPVEWDELKLDPDGDFYVSSESDHTPSSYLRTILPKWKKLVKSSDLKPGSPLVLIITSSAIRAVQLNRDITDFKTEECKCAKLFAKHFKIEEQQKYLSKNICHIGLGTPNRICSLIKNGSLHLDSVKSVVLDWNWRDKKFKRMADIIDLRKDLVVLLQTYIIPHIHANKCKIGIL
ncbi:protein CMSS1-like [Saccostrea echinata]|uniref:protein CMSS1-like n=1 Tax=Saccostrea echinata TaxID=191078 RepID=UPI002A8388C0|nr:protein CMSS1-like [Saccostrea echinata]